MQRSKVGRSDGLRASKANGEEATTDFLDISLMGLAKMRGMEGVRLQAIGPEFVPATDQGLQYSCDDADINKFPFCRMTLACLGRPDTPDSFSDRSMGAR